MGRCPVYPVQPKTGEIGTIKVSVADLAAQSGGRWLPCDGRLIDQTAYPELYAASEIRFQTLPAGVPDDLSGQRVTLTVNGVTAAFVVETWALWRGGCFAWATSSEVNKSKNTAVLLRLRDGRWERVEGIEVSDYTVLGGRIYPLSRQVLLAVCGTNRMEYDMFRGNAYLSADGGETWRDISNGNYLVAPRLVEEGGVQYVLAAGTTKGSGSNSSNIYISRFRVTDGQRASVSVVSNVYCAVSNGPSKSGIAYMDGTFLCYVAGYNYAVYGKLAGGELTLGGKKEINDSFLVTVFQGNFILATEARYYVVPNPYAASWSNRMTTGFQRARALIPYGDRLLEIDTDGVRYLDRIDLDGYHVDGGDIKYQDSFAPIDETAVYQFSDVEDMGIPVVLSGYNQTLGLCCKGRQLPREPEQPDGRKTFILVK